MIAQFVSRRGTTQDPVIDFVSPTLVRKDAEGVEFKVFGRNFTPASLIFVESVGYKTTFVEERTLSTGLDQSVTRTIGQKRVFVHDTDSGAISNDASFEVVAMSDPSIARGHFGVDANWFVDPLLASLRHVRIDARARGAKLSYDASKAFQYAADWCEGGNVCDTEYQFDCTHFMCHCLAGGGVSIANPDSGANCPAGLNVRVEYLAQAFEQLVAQYDNVRRLTFDDLTSKGDYGLLKSWIGTANHAFLLNDRVNASGQSARIFGHTNNRCGQEEVSASFIDAVYYRIDSV